MLFIIYLIDCEPTTDQPPALPKAYQPISSKHLLMSYNSIIVMFQGTCRGFSENLLGEKAAAAVQKRKGEKIMQIPQTQSSRLKDGKESTFTFSFIASTCKGIQKVQLRKKNKFHIEHKKVESATKVQGKKHLTTKKGMRKVKIKGILKAKFRNFFFYFRAYCRRIYARVSVKESSFIASKIYSTLVNRSLEPGLTNWHYALRITILFSHLWLKSSNSFLSYSGIKLLMYTKC